MRLPDGFTVRSPSPEDAQAVTNLVVACDIDEFGQPEFGLEDVLAMWRRKNFSLQTDAWMIFAPEGTPVAYSDIYDAGGLVRLNNNSCVHPRWKNRGIEDWILENAEAWARTRVTDREIIIRHVVNADNPAKVERMRNWGYCPVRIAWIMQIVLDHPQPEPVVPDGIVIRSFERGHDEHAVWACIQESFRDLWQHQDVPYQEWASFVLQHAAFAPELSYIAVDGNEVAGATITLNDDLGAWVQQVGVRRHWRNRGIGLALLRKVFDELYGLGVPHAGLEVDAENPSGALRLYERAGMRVKEHFTEFRKELDPVMLPA